MKQVALSKNSRWFRVLDKIGALNNGNTLCDIARHIMAASAVGLILLFICVGFLMPYGNMIGWIAAMVINGFTWIPIDPIIPLLCVVYGIVAFNGYLDFKKKKGVDVLGLNKENAPRAVKKVHEWLDTPIAVNEKSWWHRLLFKVDILTYWDDKNTRGSVILHSIGFLAGAIMILTLGTALIAPVIAFIGWLGMVLYKGAWFMPYAFLCQVWFCYALIAILVFLVWLIVFIARGGKRVFENSEFTTSLWRSIKDKTCVKFEVTE